MKALLLALVALFGFVSSAHAAPGTFAVNGSFAVNNTQAWDPEFDEDELIWEDFDPSVLSDGAVSALTSKAPSSTTVAVQATGANQPTAAAGVINFTAGQNQFLTIPANGSSGRQFRATVLLFKANIAGAANASGSFVDVNGSSTTADNRQPWLGYTKSPSQLSVQWNGADPNYTTAVNNPADNVWHVWIMRRVNGVVKSSIDCGTEVASSGNNLVVVRNTTNLTGQIGDTRASSIGWTLGRLFFLQGEMTDDQQQRFCGWAMWKMGVQANLPGGHPYASAPPTTKPFVMPYQTNTLATWNNVILPTGVDDSHSGTPLNLTGLSEIWRVDFNSSTDIADDTTGPIATPGAGPLYAPVQDSAGAVTEQSPGSTPNVMSVSGGNAVLQDIYGAPTWYGTNLVSVNRDGRGNTFDPRKGTIYFESRIKADNTQLGPLKMAWWMKADSEFYYGTLPRTEIDMLEAYYDYLAPTTGTSNVQDHGTYHNWPPVRSYGTRLFQHEQLGKITSMKTTTVPPWPNNNNIFDGNFHTFGAMITATNLIYYCDGLELFRQPSYPDMYRPLYAFISVDDWDLTVTSPTALTEDVDYVRVLQPFMVLFVFARGRRRAANDEEYEQRRAA